MYLRFMKQDWVSKQRMPIIGANTTKNVSGVKKYLIQGYDDHNSVRLIAKGKDTINANYTINVVINSSAGFLFGFSKLNPNEAGYDPFGSMTLYSWNDYVKNGGVSASLLSQGFRYLKGGAVACI